MTKKNKNWFLKHPLLSAGIIVIGMFLLLILGVGMRGVARDNSVSSTQKTQTKQVSSVSKTVSVGDEARLSQEGFDVVLIAIDKQAFDDLAQAHFANDKIGWNQVYNEGRAFLVDENTKVLILERAYGSYKFRILEGDYYGETGWTWKEYVFPA